MWLLLAELSKRCCLFLQRSATVMRWCMIDEGSQWARRCVAGSHTARSSDAVVHQGFFRPGGWGPLRWLPGLHFMQTANACLAPELILGATTSNQGLSAVLLVELFKVSGFSSMLPARSRQGPELCPGCRVVTWMCMPSNGGSLQTA